ncbi:MAG: superoxide dismutase family protein [Anaerolineae bacterium]|nr:superoxide dismutase family protein [Anaerolineae bacterium]
MRGLVVVVALALMAGSVLAQGQQASAELKNGAGQVVGNATFTQAANGVQVRVQISNLDPGAHGIHLHAVGKCEGPDFATAGGHFNPTSKQHGYDNPAGPHAGDLGNPPNITVGADRTATLNVTTTMVTLSAGVNSLMDADGSALVIHAATDDNKTDPSGNSGARIACGVIVPMQAAMPTSGGTPNGWLMLGLGVMLVLSGALMRRRLV